MRDRHGQQMVSVPFWKLSANQCLAHGPLPPSPPTRLSHSETSLHYHHESCQKWIYLTRFDQGNVGFPLGFFLTRFFRERLMPLSPFTLLSALNENLRLKGRFAQQWKLCHNLPTVAPNPSVKQKMDFKGFSSLFSTFWSILKQYNSDCVNNGQNSIIH